MRRESFARDARNSQRAQTLSSSLTSLRWWATGVFSQHICPGKARFLPVQEGVGWHFHGILLPLGHFRPTFSMAVGEPDQLPSNFSRETLAFSFTTYFKFGPVSHGVQSGQ